MLLVCWFGRKERICVFVASFSFLYTKSSSHTTHPFHVYKSCILYAFLTHLTYFTSISCTQNCNKKCKKKKLGLVMLLVYCLIFFYGHFTQREIFIHTRTNETLYFFSSSFLSFHFLHDIYLCMNLTM